MRAMLDGRVWLLGTLVVWALVEGGSDAVRPPVMNQEHTDDPQTTRIVETVPAPPATAQRMSAPPMAKLVEAASRAHGVDAALIHAVIHAESAYDPKAVSKAGAIGLMQLMPETAKRYGVRDLFDPAENIRGGVRYLKELLALFNGDVELAIAAYNAGENAVIRAGHRIPPYPQTEAFVPRVIEHYRRLRESADVRVKS